MNPVSAATVGSADVVTFWREAGPDKWFAKDPELDRLFRERFLDLHMQIATRGRDEWMTSAEGALALILLTDQFPRNAFSATAHMYATDPLARLFAREAEAAGHWRGVDPELRPFLSLPFMHSEDLSDQDLSVRLAERLAEPFLKHAAGHCDVIRRFGRFPHRNAMLARAPTAEEARFLADGGFAG